MTNKICKTMKAEILKMQMADSKSSEISLEMLKEIGDMKILLSSSLVSEKSMEFTQIFPAGNQIRSFMKIVEKLSYLEIRFMNLLLDGHEAQRRLSQDLADCSSFSQMKEAGKNNANEFVSARLRFKDHLKIDMNIIQAQWEEIASEAAKHQLRETVAKIESLQENDGKAKELAMWSSWKEILEQFLQINWQQEIERFQMVEG